MEALKKVTVALTGAAGNMGDETVLALVQKSEIGLIKILLHGQSKRSKKLVKKYGKLIKSGKLEPIYGSIAEYETCLKLIDGADYVVNLAAVIPPLADKKPAAAEECNERGVDALVKAIESKGENQPKLVHISTMALYGNRNALHPFARVGDPLMVSPYDIYAATKLRGEFRVLESNIKTWAVLRQNAMLHKNMLADNMHDGLMFHTVYNCPLEWVTDVDSGRLIANIIEKDCHEDLNGRFWKRVFNIGGPKENCVTGFDVLNDGFAIIGGSLKDFFKPNDSATRNFHGAWFYDSDALDELFHYKSQTMADYWATVAKTHKIFTLGKLVPKKLINKTVFDKLRRDTNSPAYWAKSGHEEKLVAYFGGRDEYERIPADWSEINLLSEGKDENGNAVDLGALKDREKAELPYLGYDYDKPDSEITASDIEAVAAAHGGKVDASGFDGDMYAKLDWVTQDGESFTASPYTVMRAGHWFNPIYKGYVWDFDRLAKKDKIYAGIWYDSHGRDENVRYSADENFVTHAEKTDDENAN